MADVEVEGSPGVLGIEQLSGYGLMAMAHENKPLSFSVNSLVNRPGGNIGTVIDLNKAKPNGCSHCDSQEVNCTPSQQIVTTMLVSVNSSCNLCRKFHILV